MIAFAWKMLAWFGIGVVIALGVLIVPLHVAAERKKLNATTQAVAQAERDIRALETEFETRGNIAQLEKWNGETLRLSAPVAGQYVRDEAALASLDFNHPLGSGGDVRMAAAIVPSQLSAPTGMIAPAVATTAPATTAPSTAAPATAAPAMVRMASTTTSASQPLPMRAVVSVKTAAVTRKAQAVAMLDRQLLSDSMIGDLARGASAEAGRLR